MPEGQPDLKQLHKLAVLSQIGLEMAAPIGLGVALDYYLGWAPWASICGAVLGLVGGMTHLIAIVNQGAAKDSAKRQRDDL
jgi:F0F1-type ATP synthase assembly protein I